MGGGSSEANSVSYAELWDKSDSLAAYLLDNAPVGKPVVVYGHKSALMLVSFVAAIKAGLTYSPIDVAYPADRVNDILDQIGKPLVLDLSDCGFTGDEDLTAGVLPEGVVSEIAGLGGRIDPSCWIKDDTPFYLLFTSGSTGRPKGVQMPSRCADAFLRYFSRFFPLREDGVSFNRVPYTFDVSLFDLIPGLAAGYTLYALEAEEESSMKASFEALSRSDMTVWISTPSYVEMCLADPLFNAELLPKLDTFVLCGEVFRNATALKMLERFPGAKVYNTYGPTETQAVSDILIDEQMAHEISPLPVGTMNPEMKAIIRDVDSGEILGCGELGEIYLAGATVSAGYYGRPDLTERVFGEINLDGGLSARCYRTGDKGFVDEEGRLYCLGRLDFQVKINGFRVELGDVEQALTRLPAIKEAVVLPKERDGRVVHLVAHVMLEDSSLEGDLSTAIALKKQLSSIVPEYMIPKKMVFHREFPLNNNGKIDRKALA
ncbi:amino acid adenylation domain-containing protein [Parvibacter caecicola]|uniref:amino acid adenylation domain-containing protein n=1 Tax=Parvibacter caecicola TaxID=747645 RepID=UPI002149A79A|nr:amino acid adenylation domain-containing protein [Parvibacter caecicola]MCR2041990.1 amino acid adenylation domain-containing protein [Parvibacter caecicola]